mgnify:FL=1
MGTKTIEQLHGTLPESEKCDVDEDQPFHIQFLEDIYAVSKASQLWQTHMSTVI